MDNKDTIRNNLARFGLTKPESDIYLALYGQDPMTVVDLTKSTRLPRTTIYDTVDKLIEKSLIEKCVKYKTTAFRAFPITILEDTILQEESRVRSLSDSLSELSKLLPTISKPTGQTEVRYYHGAFGFKQMITRTLEAENGTIGYSQFGRVEVVGEKFMNWWKEEMRIRKIHDRVITNDMPEIRKFLTMPKEKSTRDPFQETRVLPRSKLAVSGDITIYNNIYAITIWNDSEITGIEIESPLVISLQKSIFETLWDIAKPWKYT
jgi:sugar-specific transcriptional regulator TrmB